MTCSPEKPAERAFCMWILIFNNINRIKSSMISLSSDWVEEHLWHISPILFLTKDLTLGAGVALSSASFKAFYNDLIISDTRILPWAASARLQERPWCSGITFPTLKIKHAGHLPNVQDTSLYSEILESWYVFACQHRVFGQSITKVVWINFFWIHLNPNWILPFKRWRQESKRLRLLKAHNHFWLKNSQPISNIQNFGFEILQRHGIFCAFG